MPVNFASTLFWRKFRSGN